MGAVDDRMASAVYITFLTTVLSYIFRHSHAVNTGQYNTIFGVHFGDRPIDISVLCPLKGGTCTTIANCPNLHFHKLIPFVNKVQKTLNGLTCDITLTTVEICCMPITPGQLALIAQQPQPVDPYIRQRVFQS